ncbi:Aspartate/methionine/tyrosine aminotransferase [Sphingomonas carotinifaciens]|uniref:Aminotransferase class I/II-fold pyridoxal phosphate-dependent enzyme n=2 Tax=Sphingomonas carotinifaciens TaxID=1166323 RepID=A0A1G7PZI9_9SPHN|nr:pyridoxal phosphate-dependent aminotransferase [Sphingomonas carotinifaciens]MWC45659.1 aminotransferase class I/II-fold pyridoxal phosphate-dependent enzyme [Sphingomonas carotinifaciens]SDF91722.1 Aspartate/methionine/tyrosine aminotransferase [Sphingomonas carotinifaciens]
MNETYAQWVRGVIGRKRSHARTIPLFDSSVPEPANLLQQTIEDGFRRPVTSRYTSAFNGGNPFVLELLATRYELPREQIICTTGATGALSLICRGLLSKADHVIVETPGFDLFSELARSAGAHVSYFRRAAEQGFAANVEAIAQQITPDTKLIMLSNLHNPSGATLSTEELNALVELAERHGILVAVDEVYSDYAAPLVSSKAAVGYSPNFISINSLTKIFGLSTLRCGWLVAAPAVIEPLRDLSERQDFGISNLAHAVAALVLERAAQFRAVGDAILRPAREEMVRRFDTWRSRGLIAGELPEFGCICFPKLIGVRNTRAFSEALLAKSNVIVAPGEFFGEAGHVRLGFGRPLPELVAGLDALEEALVEQGHRRPLGIVG